jgi:mono/diheme cytochrome c family protein
MHRRIGSLLAVLISTLVAHAADAPHPIVPAFERFYAGGNADAAAGGRLLLAELNCVSCHADASVARKQAPILDEIGTRVRAGWLKRFLADPQGAKPGTTMPKMLAEDPQRDAKIEALTHFLASTGTLRQDRVDLKGIVLGRDLYQKVGCVACHGPRDGAGQPVKIDTPVVPLPDLKAKYTIRSLAEFLEQPHRSRPSGRMPQLLNAKEAKDVANYLLTGLKVDMTLDKGTTTFAYYEGAWDKVPDFSKVKPKQTGLSPAFDLGVALRGDDYAIRFDGVFKAERDGNYKFTLESDDGSVMWIDGRKVVDNDGVHPMKGASGQVTLTKGVHRVSVAFFQVGGGAELIVSVQGPGLSHQPLAPFVAANEAGLESKSAAEKKSPTEDELDVKPELVAKGKAVFVSAGCISCHEMKSAGSATTHGVVPTPFTRLKPEGGCLRGAAGVPQYNLSLAQQAALAAAIKSHAPPSQAPAEVVKRTMETFNCYACHTRGKVGGPVEELNKFFVTTQPEMGDEARVPPPLDGAGAKLNPDYLRSLLDRGGHDRPYMQTRMPGFGNANVGGLVAAFATLDMIPSLPPTDFATTPGKVKAAGRYFVGAQSLSCIKCHTFAGQKAEGVQGIDLTLMSRRLNRDWFIPYMFDPQRFRPGTRMPGSFPDGKTFYPNILGGKAEAQIDSIWAYLSDGTSAQAPLGLGKKSIPLIPTSGAIIYRNFITGAGTRAIAVGYPEKVNLAFDANELRLALLWQGSFIDAAKHWTDRGAGFEGPLGDNILRFPAGPSLAVLAKPDAAWPTSPAKEHGWRFDGYRLSPDDRPTFLYSHDGLKVEDTPSAVAGAEPSLRRTLKLTSERLVEGLYFRAATGDKITPLADGWYSIDGWKTRVAGAQIRKSGSKMELLVPVKGTMEIVQEIVW